MHRYCLRYSGSVLFYASATVNGLEESRTLGSSSSLEERKKSCNNNMLEIILQLPRPPFTIKDPLLSGVFSRYPATRTCPPIFSEGCLQKGLEADKQEHYGDSKGAISPWSHHASLSSFAFFFLWCIQFPYSSDRSSLRAQWGILLKGRKKVRFFWFVCIIAPWILFGLNAHKMSQIPWNCKK